MADSKRLLFFKKVERVHDEVHDGCLWFCGDGVSSLLPARFGDGVRVLRTSGAFGNLDNREMWTPISCPAHILNITGDSVGVLRCTITHPEFMKRGHKVRAGLDPT